MSQQEFAAGENYGSQQLFATTSSASLTLGSGIQTWKAPYNTPPLYALQQALVATSAGTSDTYLVCAGDSETIGYQGGNTPSGYTGAYPNSYPVALAALVAGFGYTVNTDALLGDRNLFLNGVTNYGSYDSRVSNPGGWALSSNSTLSLGGNAFFNTTTTDALTYTPTQPFNALDVLYNTTPGGQTATVRVNGVNVGSINCNAAAGMSKLVITGLTRQVQAITITPNVAGGTFVAGLVPRDTTQKQLYIHVIAAAGAQANSMTGGQFGLAAFITAGGYPYSAAVISFGVNEAVANTSPATFSSNLTTEAAQLKNTSNSLSASAPPSSVAVGCDAIMVTGPPIDPAQAASARQEALYLAMSAACGAAMPMLNVREQAGTTYANAVTSGYMGADPNHWIKAGYAFVAARLMSLLQSGLYTAKIMRTA